MENQGENEAQLDPGSSSSSTSPPSSPSSSSSSSSSSPSNRPQSFASSRSSQKELSAPSSSGSSSTSSSPFSGPSSPAHAAIDQATSSANEEFHTHELADNAGPLSSSNTATLPSPPAQGGSADEGTAGSSDRQDPLGESQVIVELVDNNGRTVLTAPGLEAPSLGGSKVIVNNGHGTASEGLTHDNSNSQTPDMNFHVNSPDQLSAVEATEVLEACSESLLSSDIIRVDLHAASAKSSDEGHRNDDQVLSEVDGCKGFNREQGRLSMDETSLQLGQNYENISSSNSSLIETSTNTFLLHDEVNVSRDHGCSYATYNAGGHSEANTAFMKALELGAIHGSCPLDLGDKSSDNARIPFEMPSKSVESEQVNSSAPVIKTIEKSSKSSKDVLPDISGLPRAKTMPSGSLEVVNGEVCPSRPSTFKRSSTDKSKAGGEMPSRTPGPKISKKKQKRLMKRMCTLQKDGTVELDLEKSARFAPDMFEPAEWEDYYRTPGDEDIEKAIPPLQIAMLIVGTRGDVQPFVAIGKRLQEHGHRVRLATHSNFQDFVLKAGLEFYPLGGDPKILAGYMVKNKGFLPSGPSEIRTQKKQLKAIINSLLPACTRPDGNGVPFKAQAIIANPPAYGHVHVAEALKVPLHIFFTMPWTATSEFPHPLSRVGHSAANRLSYQVVDSLIWWGIRGLINDFRKRKLGLRPVTYLGGSQQSVSKLPTGYIWSPHLVPKPKDWGAKIDVVGFCFLNLSQDYNPPVDQLVKWLAAGPAPIYVGFGSLPVEDPSSRMTKIILDALKETSQRGIIDKGWGGIGTMVDLPESVFLLHNCPHDWLFSQCAAVCPTTIVPFFGDQAFWGGCVHARGVGPAPIPVDQFSFEKLVHAIEFMLNKEQRAISLAEAMEEEDGVEGAVNAFHRHLPCDVPQAPARLPK